MSTTEDVASTTSHTFCRLCEVMCGLSVSVADGEVTKVRGDRGHPVSQGFACNKGLLYLDVHRDEHRLDHPLRRTGDGFEPVAWPDAVDDVADRLRAVVDRHGPGAVAVYIGNPNAFNVLAGPAAALFLLSLGSARIFSAATQDCSNKFTVSEILYGSPDIHPVPDLEHTDHLLLLGSNPRISKGSFISLPDPVAAMRRIVERGGSVTFVNPLRMEPDLGETVQVRPDTDVFLLAAMLHRIESTVGFDVAGAGDRVHNVDALREWVREWSPERVAPVVGVDAAVIERLADELAAAPTAAVHISTGVNMGRHGALAYFLVQMLSLVTGNLDRPGGNVVRARAAGPMPATSGPGADSLEETPWGPVRRSKGSLPAALLPSWIRDPDEPIRALFVIAGNPLLSFGGADEVASAFADLDLLVSIDLYRNATAELAHVILPATDAFERPDLNAFTQGVQGTPHIQLTDAVVPPHAERKHETEIFALLAEAMGVPAGLGTGVDGLAMMYDAELAAHGLSIADLATRERGLALLDDVPDGSFLASGVLSVDGRIDCAPELIVRAQERAEPTFEEMLAEPDGQLRLITRRTRNTLNSAMANVSTLKSRGADRNPLWMHPDDAAARGLADGDLAEVRNEVGSLRAGIAFDPNLRPGVVAMTHGFGHEANPGMPVAHAHPGVNVNRLTPSGPGTFDPLSGMTHLTGIRVDVEAVDPASDEVSARP